MRLGRQRILSRGYSNLSFCYNKIPISRRSPCERNRQSHLPCHRSWCTLVPSASTNSVEYNLYKHHAFKGTRADDKEESAAQEVKRWMYKMQTSEGKSRSTAIYFSEEFISNDFPHSLMNRNHVGTVQDAAKIVISSFEVQFEP